MLQAGRKKGVSFPHYCVPFCSPSGERNVGVNWAVFVTPWPFISLWSWEFISWPTFAAGLADFSPPPLTHIGSWIEFSGLISGPAAPTGNWFNSTCVNTKESMLKTVSDESSNCAIARRLESAAGPRTAAAWQADSRSLKCRHLAACLCLFCECGMCRKMAAAGHLEGYGSRQLPFYMWPLIYLFFFFLCDVADQRQATEQPCTLGPRRGQWWLQLILLSLVFIDLQGITTAWWGVQLQPWHRWGVDPPAQGQDGLQHLCRTRWPSRSSKEQSAQ